MTASWDVGEHRYEQRGNQIFVDGRKVGWITKLGNKTRVFVSPRKRQQHYFRIFEGWGLSRDLFTYLLKVVEVQEIHLKIGKALTLTSQMLVWEQHSIPYHKEPYEPQIILPEKYFKSVQLTMAQLMEGAKR